MNPHGIGALLRPNVTTLGYALFLAINASSVWGGLSPFLPISFQTTPVVLRFFSTQALVFSLTYFFSAAGSYLYPLPTRSFFVGLASGPYMLGWCCLIGAIYLPDHVMVLVTCGGAMLGLGSAGFYMLWQRLFASQDSDTGNRELILGTAFGSVLYFSLYLIPQAVTAFLIPLVFLPLFGLAIVVRSRQLDLDQAMFSDIPREHSRVYLSVLRDYWRTALCVGMLGFCTGIMRALAIDDPSVGSFVNMLSMGASLIAAIVILVLWHYKGVRFNVMSIFRVVFPFIITSFLLLPFAAMPYIRWMAAVLYALYSVAIMVMMITCAQAARDRGINPVFIYGFFAGVVYLLHDVGFLSGTVAGNVMVMGVTPLAVISLVAIYLLGLMYFVGQGGLRNALGRKGEAASNIELLALTPSSRSNRRETAGTDPTEGSADTDIVADQGNPGSKTPQQKATQATEPVFRSGADDGYRFRDRISKQAELVRQRYRLSARETEVMELIVRGNTVSTIAEELIVSENTIRTHSKRIYAKLDIHKKQELIDLIHSFNPNELSG